MVAFEDRNAELPKLTIDISSSEVIRGDFRMCLLERERETGLERLVYY